MKPNDGGPAFPQPPDGQRFAPEPGMSLRDYFAGQALPAVISQCNNDDRDGMAPEAYFAMKAYALADSMIKERAA